ncbi:histidine phosphatase family protein [Lachnobacterium bovis]|uniref:histidine phosphatase family protein n=1 Tax=Lachnobacterium bovis TaxID=140626 RepID=UPI0003B43AC3|nr:histidine phosphatase family protein [Lachnobacterium bovis]
MIELYVGGAAQGKLQTVLKKHELTENYIINFDGDCSNNNCQSLHSVLFGSETYETNSINFELNSDISFCEKFFQKFYSTFNINGIFTDNNKENIDKNLFEASQFNIDIKNNKKYIIFNKFNFFIKYLIFDKNYPERKIDISLVEKLIVMFIKKINENNNVIIISDEIGNCVVPMLEEERVYRELNGSVLQKLAEDADIFSRIFCGVEQKIKKQKKKMSFKMALVRHGKTHGNLEGRYIGKTDECLTDKGIIELKQMKDDKFYPACSVVFSSPLIRCSQTAKIVFENKEIFLNSNLEEMDFGRFEGKNYNDLKENSYYQKWIDSNGEIPFPEGEDKESFIKRVGQGFDEILQLCYDLFSNFYINMKDVDFAIVAHGGTIMAIMNILLGEGYYEYRVKNGRGYIVSFTFDGKKIDNVEIEKEI